jgi:hypothetical protein
MFEFVQNNNNARSGFTLLKRSEMVSNLLKRWRDDFATVKRQRVVSGLFKRNGMSSRLTSSAAYNNTHTSFLSISGSLTES